MICLTKWKKLLGVRKACCVSGSKVEKNCLCTYSCILLKFVVRFCRDIFLPKEYMKLVSRDLVTAMEKCYCDVRKEQDITMNFMGRLVGKLSVSGYGGT